MLKFGSPHPSETYAEQLETTGEGLALWYPEPHTSGEVQIGDVGYIHDGAFIRLLNVVSPDRTRTLPDGFEQLHILDPWPLDTRERALTPGHYISKSIARKEGQITANISVPASGGANASWKYVCNKQKGAALILGNFARRERILSQKRFQKYLGKHYVSLWKMTPDEPGQKLVLVRGYVKTTADWVATTFTSSGSELTVSLGAGIPAGAELHSAVSWKIEINGPIMNRWGEYAHDSENRLSRNQLPTDAQANQCIFMIGCYAKRRYAIRSIMLRGGAGPHELPDAGDANHGLEGEGIRADDGREDVVMADDLPQTTLYGSMDALLDYILEYSEAAIAVCCEEDLQFRLLGHDWPDDVSQWLRDEAPRIEVDDDRTVSLLDAIRNRRTYYIKNGIPCDAHLPDGPSPTSDEERSRSLPRAEALGTGELVLSNRPGGALDWPHLSLKDEKLESGASLAMAVSPDGRRVATSCDDSSILLWDVQRARAVARLEGHSDAVWTLAFSLDGSRLVSGAEDATAKIWDVGTATPSMSHEMDAQGGAVWIAVFSPDGTMVATGSTDCSAKIWDATNGNLRRELEEHPADVTQMSFSPDNRTLATCADCFCFLWDVQTGEKKRELVGHSGVIWCMRFSNQGDRIITGSEDSTARVWDADTGDELLTVREHTGPVWSVAFSRDDGEVATASYDCAVATCDSWSGEHHHTFFDGQNDSPVNAAAYSKSGGLLASGAADGIVRLWDVTTGSLVAEFRGHEEKVKAVAFTEDDSDIISSSEDGTVRAWNVHDVLRLY